MDNPTPQSSLESEPAGKRGRRLKPNVFEVPPGTRRAVTGWGKLAKMSPGHRLADVDGWVIWPATKPDPDAVRARNRRKNKAARMARKVHRSRK